MKVYFEKSAKEDKTAYLGVQSGALSGFAALRYDTRALLRALECFLRFALRRKR